MKITVIGTINKDLILPFQSASIESFGGIFYTATILSKLLPEATITPVSYIGEDVQVTIGAVLKQFPNISTEGLIPWEGKSHKVILEYESPHSRKEKSLFHFPPLTWQQVEPHLEADMIMVNMICGWDVELDAFRKIGQAHRERLYFDLHYLIMGIDDLGRRFPEPPQNVYEWLKQSKFVQMNEREFSEIQGEARNEVDFYNRRLQEDQVLLITRGSKGASLVYQRGEMIGRKEIPGHKLLHPVDPTGCGDAFGAGFVCNYLESGDINKAVEFANLVGAANAALRGTNEMHLLPERIAEIRRLSQP